METLLHYVWKYNKLYNPKYRHHIDKACNSIILHVVENSDVDVQTENECLIPQLVLPILEKVISFL